MVSISVRFSLPPERMFRDSRALKQLPYATAQALNAIAMDVKADAERRLPQVLDEPTPFTRRGFIVLRANRAKLYAEAKAMRIQNEYLKTQEGGGVRTPKRRALTVPAGTRLNQYGNMPKGHVKRLLARTDVFSGRVRGIGGIWQRTAAGHVKLLVAYRDEARYRPRLGYVAAAVDVVRARKDQRFREEFEKALATAR